MNKPIALLMAIFVITGLLSIAFADWPMDGHDAGRSGYYPGVFPTQKTISGQKGFNGSVSEIIIGGNTIFVRINNDTGEHVTALDPASNQIKWSTDVPEGPNNGGIIYTANMLLVAHEDGVISLDMSGHLLWEISNGSSEGILLRDNYLLMVDPFAIRMYNLNNRQMLWYKTYITDRSLSECAIGDNAVYEHRSSKLTAWDISDGHQIYEKTNVTTGSGLVYSNGKLYVGTNQGDMNSIDAATGNFLWTFETDGKKEDQFLPEAMTPAVGGGNIVFGALDYKLYCLDDAGNLKWKTPNVEPSSSNQPAITDNLVFVTDNYDKLRCFDIATGNQVWSLGENDLGASPTGNLVLFDGKIYGKTLVGGIDSEAYMFSVPEFSLYFFAALFMIATFVVAMVFRRRGTLERQVE